MHASTFTAALPACSASALHRDLNARAALFARRNGFLHELSTGRSPSVIFGEDEQGRHGNFHPASYSAIQGDGAWRARLEKAHTAGRRARPRADWHWRELDCAASSDALLMNIFCDPAVFRSGHVARLLGVQSAPKPSFGVHPRLPRVRGLVDTTEVDMELDGLLLEAKLTEGGFQTASTALLARFPTLEEVFEVNELPRTASGTFLGYQLIRSVLAAAHTGSSFCVLCDGRRHDLIVEWQRVLSAVPSAALRCRAKLLTWQELAAALPLTLQSFLVEKYGILPA